MSAVLAQYQATIATVPAIVAQQTELNDSIALIDTISQAQGSPIEGVTLDKKAVLELMIVKAMQVAGQLKAYASVIGDNTLRVKATISRNTFMEKRDDLRDDVAAEMHDLATPLLAPLADYGTTAATLAALSTRIGLYVLAVPSTRTARGHVTTLTGALEAELRRADMIQRERLDGLMEQFSDTNVTLYNDYKNARKLIDLGGGGSGPANPTPPPP